jgi:hypothetical protein
MGELAYFKPEVLVLKDHRTLDEKWVQSRIGEDPTVLGLGALVLRDRERSQPGAGRLDLLLQDPESLRRYEVELQLGKTDETHIIRTIEYWDIERKRYPQYEHCAVIVAEDITSRFLNVISLFNGSIPLIALKMQAIVVDNKVGLIFTKVLDELRLGLVDEDEEVQEPTDRGYWEAKGSAKTLRLADTLLGLIQTFAPGYELKYNKYYIGLSKDGQPNNFCAFKPQKGVVRLQIKLDRSDITEKRLEDAGLEVQQYEPRFKHYPVRLSAEDIEKGKPLLIALMKEAFDARE